MQPKIIFWGKKKNLDFQETKQNVSIWFSLSCEFVDLLFLFLSFFSLSLSPKKNPRSGVKRANCRAIPAPRSYSSSHFQNLSLESISTAILSLSLSLLSPGIQIKQESAAMAAEAQRIFFLPLDALKKVSPSTKKIFQVQDPFFARKCQLGYKMSLAPKKGTTVYRVVFFSFLSSLLGMHACMSGGLRNNECSLLLSCSLFPQQLGTQDICARVSVSFSNNVGSFSF